MAVYCIDRDGPALYLDCQECEDRACEAFACLVLCFEGYGDYETFYEKLDNLLSRKSGNVMLVCECEGDGSGIAEKYARERGYSTRVFGIGGVDGDADGKCEAYEDMQRCVSRAKERGAVLFENEDNHEDVACNLELAGRYGNPARRITVERTI